MLFIRVQTYAQVCTKMDFSPNYSVISSIYENVDQNKNKSIKNTFYTNTGFKPQLKETKLTKFSYNMIIILV